MQKIVTLLLLSISLYASGKANTLSYPKTLPAKAKEALAFCKANNYNTTFCILIDLSIHSGLKRFFVWDFKKNTSVQKAMVSHGCGKMPWSWTLSRDKAVLSNAHGGHCSSEGKYRIGKRGYSNWGININYQLHGLDKTNSNALARQIVLHSWERVRESEVYPQGTPEGWGCPAISNDTFRVLDKKLKKVDKRVLMWVYD